MWEGDPTASQRVEHVIEYLSRGFLIVLPLIEIPVGQMQVSYWNLLACRPESRRRRRIKTDLCFFGCLVRGADLALVTSFRGALGISASALVRAGGGLSWIVWGCPMNGFIGGWEKWFGESLARSADGGRELGLDGREEPPPLSASESPSLGRYDLLEGVGLPCRHAVNNRANMARVSCVSTTTAIVFSRHT